MIVDKKAHRHDLKVKHIQEVINGRKRWIVIDYCTKCEYSVARTVTYKDPNV